MPTTIAVATTAAGTAQRGANRVKTSQTSTTVRPCHQVSPTEASTGARQIGSRMPASIALAMGFGMRVIARASHGQSPVASSSTPQRTNAPTAAEKSSVRPLAATMSAAPGVDHAIEIGMRYRRLNATARMPCPTQSTNRPDAASAAVAPTACSPAISRANELANPVIEPMIPAVMGCAIEARGGSAVMGFPA
jgi:hypothetical protein